MISLATYTQEKSSLVEKALEHYLPESVRHPSVIHDAMRYAVLGNGKRIRPVLTLAVCEMFGGPEDQALIAACAIELIHSYSLVHDDLPLMDNDDFRRGQPSCHKKFGEGVALLAGDALLTLAFQILGELNHSEHSLRLIREIAEAAGTSGMIGGQVLDIQAEAGNLTLENLEEINRKKTGALIRVSCLAGAIMGGAKPEQELRILRFGEYLGFAFQLIDDILDSDGFRKFLSEKEARDKASFLIRDAKAELTPFGQSAEKLNLLADFILDRKR